MFEQKWKNFILSLVLVALTGAISSYYNSYAMSGFYNYIQLPKLTPPDEVFPIAWIILYTLMVLSFDMILNVKNRNKIKVPFQLFITNLFLQILWSFVFFANAYFMLGFAILVVLDFVVIVMIEKFYKINKIAGIMLVPYLGWLLFATYLNWAVTDLNGAMYVF